MDRKQRKTISRCVATINRDKRDYLAERAKKAALISELAEGGKIALVESGMDCDGVKYDGAVSIITANLVAVEAEINRRYEWADGPCFFGLESPSVAERIRYNSRDLALEAFEDGHPHVLYA